MFRTFFNSQLQKTASDLIKSFPVLRYGVALDNGSTQQSFLSFFTPINPEKIEDPASGHEERPGYYNVYDENEFADEDKEPNPDRYEKEIREDPPAITNKVPPEHDPRGPLGEGVL